MSTTTVETWSGADLSALGPIYPMVGTETILVILGVAFWLLFHIIQTRAESREMREEEQAAKNADRLQRFRNQ